MRISVVIPTHERREQVCRAVRSVVNGLHVPDEIIVVDDGSTDDTAAALEELDGPIEVIGLLNNRGPAHARNVGIAAIRNRWVALLDSDDWWLPNHLQKLVDYAERHPEYALHQTRERWYRGGRRVNPKRHHIPRAGDLFEPSLRLCLVSSSAVLLRKEAFDAVGGYDERLPVCEDYDLWLRLARISEFGFVDEETIEKEGGREDQLSRRHWGMDRFRVFSLAKNLTAALLPGQYESVRSVCLEKLAILRSGAERRQNLKSVDSYDRWVAAVQDARKSAGDLNDEPHAFPAFLTAAGLTWDRREKDAILSALLPFPRGLAQEPTDE